MNQRTEGKKVEATSKYTFGNMSVYTSWFIYSRNKSSFKNSQPCLLTCCPWITTSFNRPPGRRTSKFSGRICTVQAAAKEAAARNRITSRPKKIQTAIAGTIFELRATAVHEETSSIFSSSSYFYGASASFHHYLCLHEVAMSTNRVLV